MQGIAARGILAHKEQPFARAVLIGSMSAQRTGF
jgi:hypothetical protein